MAEYEEDDLLDQLPWHLRTKVLQHLEDPDYGSGHDPEAMSDAEKHYWANPPPIPPRPRTWHLWAMMLPAFLWAALLIIPGLALMLLVPPVGFLLLVAGATPVVLLIQKVIQAHHDVEVPDIGTHTLKLPDAGP